MDTASAAPEAQATEVGEEERGSDAAGEGEEALGEEPPTLRGERSESMVPMLSLPEGIQAREEEGAVEGVEEEGERACCSLTLTRLF